VHHREHRMREFRTGKEQHQCNHKLQVLGAATGERSKALIWEKSYSTSDIGEQTRRRKCCHRIRVHATARAGLFLPVSGRSRLYSGCSVLGDSSSSRVVNIKSADESCMITQVVAAFSLTTYSRRRLVCLSFPQLSGSTFSVQTWPLIRRNRR
jgi:hypothetical protein